MRLLGVVLAGALVLGCGAEARQRAINTAHEALNTLTDAVDPAYGLAIAACDAQALVIESRPDTTFEEDSAALQSLQNECNAVFEVFEQIRELQVRARRVLDDIEQGDALAILVEARSLWNALKTRLIRSGLIREDGRGTLWPVLRPEPIVLQQWGGR